MTTLLRSRSNVRRALSWGAIGALMLSGLVALAPPQPVDEEGADDRQFLRHAMLRSLRENCLFCHSDEMIHSQRLTPKQWKTEVEKMIGWGSPLPKEEQQPLIDYLAAEYPTEAPPARPARMTFQQAEEEGRPDLTLGTLRGLAERGEPAYRKNCANCHGQYGQGSDLGPNLVEKPVLWRTADYTQVVRRGRGRMPGFEPALDPVAAEDILAWLRTRR